MAGKRSNDRELHWRDVLGRQAVSGLSVRQFCSKENISEPSFYAWRRKLHRRIERNEDSPTSTRSSTDNGREFIPLKLLDGTSALEVIHPLGYRVRVTGEIDVTTLDHVLGVLDGRHP